MCTGGASRRSLLSPERPRQYAYLAQFVEQEDNFFLKIAIPSRKATRETLNKGEHNAQD